MVETVDKAVISLHDCMSEQIGLAFSNKVLFSEVKQFNLHMDVICKSRCNKFYAYGCVVHLPYVSQDFDVVLKKFLKIL